MGEVAIPLRPGLFGQFAQSFAVSTTPDPTGSYHIWAYGFGTRIDDCPTIGVWPDGDYVTCNTFPASDSSYLGLETCAFDRTAMLAGASERHGCASTCRPTSTAFCRRTSMGHGAATRLPSRAPQRRAPHGDQQA